LLQTIVDVVYVNKSIIIIIIIIIIIVECGF